MSERFFNNLRVKVEHTPSMRDELRKIFGWHCFIPGATKDIIVVLKSMSLLGDEPILVMRKERVLGTLSRRSSQRFRDQYFFRRAPLFRVPAVISMKKAAPNEDPQIDLELYMHFLEGIKSTPEKEWYNEKPIEPWPSTKIMTDIGIPLVCLSIGGILVLILEYFYPFR